MRALEGLSDDLRLGVRSLSRTPGFTAAAVLAMALGIGGTSAIFAGFDTLILRPLPLPAADRLVTLYERSAHGQVNSLSPPNYPAPVAQSSALAGDAALYLPTP